MRTLPSHGTESLPRLGYDSYLNLVGNRGKWQNCHRTVRAPQCGLTGWVTVFVCRCTVSPYKHSVCTVHLTWRRTIPELIQSTGQLRLQCAARPCLHGGICYGVEGANGFNGSNGNAMPYECECKTGWIGESRDMLHLILCCTLYIPLAYGE